MEKFYFRSYIQTRNRLGIKAVDIFKELQQAHGTQAPCYSTVQKWTALFAAGRESIEDDPRSGRPITAHTEANIELVRQIIEEDPHSTYNEIEALSSLNQNTIHSIIHESLQLRKITSRWVPHMLTEENRKERVASCRENLAMFNEGKWRLCDVVTGDESWFYWRQIGRKVANKAWVGPGESAHTVVRRSQFEAKNMITVFFKTTGLVHLHCMERGQTTNASRYIENSLKPLVAGIHQQRPKSGTKSVKLLHDNAKPHTAKIVKTYLQNAGVGIIRHPPYSPDLAPCDFWLFELVKRQLTDAADAEDLESQITEVLRNIPKDEYLKTFNKWLERMQLCINNKGEYFEHLINK
jgi:histone-lysine N-methyltransferase SETMAR